MSVVFNTFRPSTRTYCTKIKLVQHHLAICGSFLCVCWGGGGGSCGGDGMWGVMALCGGVTLEWGLSWQLWNHHRALQATTVSFTVNTPDQRPPFTHEQVMRRSEKMLEDMMCL